jgi:cell division protein FtsB
LVRRFAYTAGALLIVGYAWIALHGPHGVPGLLDKRRQVEELEKRNANLARVVEQKREHIKRLSDDPDLEIRQRLMWVKPGEKTFVLHDQEKK